jgi:hypothetical protein
VMTTGVDPWPGKPVRTSTSEELLQKVHCVTA